MLFTEDIVFITVIYIIPILIVWLFLFDTVGKWNLQIHKEDAKKGFRKRVFSFSYIMALVATSCYIILLLNNNDKYFRPLNILMIALTLVPILLSEMKFKYDKVSKEPFPNIYWNLIHLALLSFYATMALTVYQVKSVDSGKYFGTKIFLNDSIHTSDSSSYFVGKTNNYVFIYNKSDKSTLAIPSTKIEKIELKVK